MCTKVGNTYVNCKELQDSINEVKRLEKIIRHANFALEYAKRNKDRIEKEHQHVEYRRF